MGVVIPVTFLNVFLNRPWVKPDKTAGLAAVKIVFTRSAKKAVPKRLIKNYPAVRAKQAFFY